MENKEDDRTQSSHGFHATVEAKTPEEFDAKLHAAVVAFRESHEPNPETNDK